MINVKSVTRDRFLTPAEAARYQQMLAEARAERAETLEQLKTASPDFLNWEEVAEFRALVKSLCALRESKGLSREDVARASGLDSQWIADVEEGRATTSALNTLQNYAAALGQHLVLALAESP